MGFWGLPIQIETRPTDPMNTDVSVEDTIRVMISLARYCSNSPEVTHVVNACLLKLRTSKPTKKDLAREIYWWIKNHVKFRRDEDINTQELGYRDPNQELLITPMVLLNMPQPMGDCDDFSLLLTSCLVCAHIDCGFVTVAVDEMEPMRFSHVYCYAIVESGKIYLDASHGSFPGWETDRVKFRKVEWQV